jgi:uncharacterized protein (DUF1778 family)
MVPKPPPKPKPRRLGEKLEQIGVRVTPEDKAFIERAAEHANLTLSDWARTIMLTAARKELGEG